MFIGKILGVRKGLYKVKYIIVLFRFILGYFWDCVFNYNK